MKVLALALFLFPAAAPAADFQAGLEAFNRGDFAAALSEWQPLAEQGDANAQYNLGVLYANGQGVAANPQEASKWLLQAAHQGVGEAETGLANIYSDSAGAFKNYAEAAKWYRAAAGQGIASAAFSLGVMYDVGQGVQQSYTEALQWYRQAADAGYGSAMTNIAILYYNGQGVKRDLVQSYVWFTRAQKWNDPRAKDMIGMAEEKLTPAEMKKALAEVDAWQPSPKPAAPAVPSDKPEGASH